MAVIRACILSILVILTSKQGVTFISRERSGGDSITIGAQLVRPSTDNIQKMKDIEWEEEDADKQVEIRKLDIDWEEEEYADKQVEIRNWDNEWIEKSEDNQGKRDTYDKQEISLDKDGRKANADNPRKFDYQHKQEIILEEKRKIDNEKEMEKIYDKWWIDKRKMDKEKNTITKTTTDYSDTIYEGGIGVNVINNRHSSHGNQDNDGCPPYQLIWPCDCSTSEFGVQVSCYGALGPDIIHRALLPDYPSPHMEVLKIGQSQLGVLPKDILHNKTFQEMNLFGTGLKGIEEGAFDGCRNTLKILRLSSNNMKNFSFEELPRFHVLEMISLSDNQLTSIDGFVGLPPLSLTTLYLNANYISSLHPEVFYALPNLRSVNLDFNNISYIPPGVFLPLTKLEALFLKNNNIVHLSTGAFWFSTPVLRQMNIQGLGLKTLDPDVFRGVDVSAQVSMDTNKLRHLYYDSFGPLLRNVSMQYGWLSISGNWLNCECDVLWILEDEELLSHLHSATCRNITYLSDLDYHALAQECATDPYTGREVALS